jgi:SAM-dependent methyltransferase
LIALDLSQGMLGQAALKLSPYLNRIEFVCHSSLPLPFPDAAFDVVCALEVLELFPNMDEPLAEFTRVLRPGGILLTSRGTEESGRKAKINSAAELTFLLGKNGFEKIQITKWWKLFDRVIALQRGSFKLIGSKCLSHVLKCLEMSELWKWIVHHTRGNSVNLTITI